MSAGAEQSITGISKSGQDVSRRVEFTIECRGNDGNIGMCLAQSTHSLGGGDETEEANACRARNLESRDRCDGTSAGGQHRIEYEELSLCRIRRNLEVIIHRLQCVVVTIEADVADTRGWDQPQYSLNHAEPGAQNWHENKLLPGNAGTDRALEWRVDGVFLEREVGGCLICDQHRNLVDEFLEYFCWRVAITQERELMLHQWMANYEQARDIGGGGHGDEPSIFARMKEYQAVIVRLSKRVREDEDAITDLLNERSRGGWKPELITQDAERVTVVFSRGAESGR